MTKPNYYSRRHFNKLPQYHSGPSDQIKTWIKDKLTFITKNVFCIFWWPFLVLNLQSTTVRSGKFCKIFGNYLDQIYWKYLNFCACPRPHKYSALDLTQLTANSQFTMATKKRQNTLISITFIHFLIRCEVPLCDIVSQKTIIIILCFTLLQNFASKHECVTIFSLILLLPTFLKFPLSCLFLFCLSYLSYQLFSPCPHCSLCQCKITY